MSAISKVKVAVDSLELLKRALTRMGHQYVEGKSKLSSGWGSDIEVELKVTDTVRPIGFRKEDGVYVAAADWYEAGSKAEKFTGMLDETVAQIKVEDACYARNISLGSWNRDKEGNLVMIGQQW
jgi:hypothetical protein